jgi:iron complex outermembrane recepter protein
MKMSSARPVAIAIFTALPIVSFVANAQTSSGAVSSGGLDEIVVTAQRKSESIQDVPISINAFTASDIRKLGLQTSADIGLVTPNVNIAMVQGAGNQPIITIRGIGINDENTNNAGPIAIYVDDVYLSSPASQSFSMFDLERVEVLKGPQGTLYGRNTSGGLISYVSVKPTDTFSANAHLEYSSFNTIQVEGAVGGPISDWVDGRIAFVKNNSDGYIHNLLTGNDEDGANDYAGRAQLLLKPIDDLKVLLNLHGGQVNTRPAEYGHYGDLVPGTQQTAAPVTCSVAATFADQCVDLFGYTQPKGFYNGEYNRQEHLIINSYGASLRADYAIGTLSLTSISAFEHNDKVEPEDSDASPYRSLEITWGVKNDTVTQEFRVSQTQDKFNWTSGLYYMNESLRQDQPLELLLDIDKFPVFGMQAGPGEGDGIANTETDTSHQVTNAYAVFGQSEYNATDKLKFTLGGRFTYEHRTFQYAGTIAYQEGGTDNFGAPVSLIPPGTVIPDLKNSNVSWRTGVNYNFTPSVMAYASIATGFKSGDFNGGFLSTDPVQAAIQLRPVPPEKDTSYEVGLKSTFFDRRLLVNAAAFYTDYNDLQVFALIPSPDGPLNSLTSAQKAHNVGADLEFVVKPIEPFTFTAQVGLLNAQIDRFVNNVPGAASLQGLQLAFSPHVSAFLVADYKLPIGKNALDFVISSSYKSHQFYDSTNDPYVAQDAYWIENARVSFTSGKWEIAAYVKNLADKQYANDNFNLTSPFGFIQTIQGAPRWFGVELNYQF